MMSWSQATRFVRPLRDILLDSLPLFICIVRSGNLDSKTLFHRPINGPSTRMSEENCKSRSKQKHTYRDTITKES